jgi:enoyl-CoA hydratase
MGLPRLCRQYSTPPMGTYDHVLLSTPKPGVGLSKSYLYPLIALQLTDTDVRTLAVTLNRPKALNALSTALFLDLNNALRWFESDKDIGAMVITGSEKAFAAGADIKEMKDLTFSKVYSEDFIEDWSLQTSQIKKPIISAVNGYALGGGCELAMMADIIYCSISAMFGQPEIKLGIIPGAGGSQRLTKAIGKSKAMELILTGKNFSGKEAFDWGLAARVFDSPQECVDGAINTAATIAGYSRIAVKAAKEVVNKSQDLGIREGVEYERRVFHGLFGSEDQKIGMNAFAAKKKPEWSHK